VDALLGAVVGAALSGVAAVIGYWWKSRRDLHAAARRCYDRLRKLERVTKLPPGEREAVIQEEIALLGGHMDLFVVSMGGALRARTRERNWDVYESMLPVLINQDLEALRKATNAVRPLAGLRTDAAASGGR
jgi:hypothetical protein